MCLETFFRVETLEACAYYRRSCKIWGHLTGVEMFLSTHGLMKICRCTWKGIFFTRMTLIFRGFLSPDIFFICTLNTLFFQIETSLSAFISSFSIKNEFINSHWFAHDGVELSARGQLISGTKPRGGNHPQNLSSASFSPLLRFSNINSFPFQHFWLLQPSFCSLYNVMI